MKNKEKEKSSKPMQYYMYGKHTVIAALNNPNRNVKHVYSLKKQSEEIKKLYPHIDVRITTEELITKKIGHNQPHQGIIALVNSIFEKDIKKLNFNETQDRIVILDQLSDPQNIGAIIRSASAFGITKLILPNDNTPDENASIAKAASGCLELMQIAKVTNIKSAIDALKKMGFWIAGLDVNTKKTVSEIQNIDKLAIIIGSEGKGIRRLTAQSCDFLVKIPISKDVESLNASNAASIIFYLSQNNLATL